MCSSNPYPRELPKTQTTSLLAARFQRISPRWSAFWAPHYLEPQPRRRQSGGIAPCKGATHRRHAVRRLCMAQNPHRHQWRARCRGGGRAWLRRPWAAAGPGRASRRGLAAASVGGGGARPRCWSAAAGPGRASRSTTPSEARVWRSRGRAAADQHTQRPGPSKQAKRRSKTSRALRRPEHPWDHKQPGPAGNATKSSPSEPCARAGASRPGRNGCGPRCAAPRLRCR